MLALFSESYYVAILLMHGQVLALSNTIRRPFVIEAKDALVADGRCLLFLINFLFNFIYLFK